MYNDRDEMYEVSDLDQDIALRKELIAEAKELMAAEEPDARAVANLRKAWNRIAYWESVLEDELMEEFDQYLDAYYAKKRASYESIQAVKEAIIEEAKALLEAQDFNKAAQEMDALMTRWKEAGNAGKEKDDELWETFHAIRKQFYELKRAYWANRKEQFEKARAVKTELIAKARELADSEQWQKTSNAYRELMEEWKAAGSAGREHEDELWDAFKEARQQFYDRRNAHYDELHEEQHQKYEAKQALIAQAKAIADTKEYTKEHTAAMKELGVKWKAVGSCGKEKEDQVWKVFRSIMDDYFAGLKAWNEEKHANWLQHMQEIRNRKAELIQNQKRQIEHMKQDMVGLLGQRAIDEMEEAIEDKKTFIEELEKEIADIDARLTEA